MSLLVVLPTGKASSDGVVTGVDESLELVEAPLDNERESKTSEYAEPSDEELIVFDLVIAKGLGGGWIESRLSTLECRSSGLEHDAVDAGMDSRGKPVATMRRGAYGV